MNLSRPFIERPVATTLLTVGVLLAGALAYSRLPVSPLPQVDYPTISVSASLPGADPETVSTSVAEPLERYLGQIADVTEITSSSSTGQTRITLQFDLDRDINGAARDVQAAINAAAADVSTSLTSNPSYRKVNPADAPLMIIALTSETLTRGQLYDAASNVLQQRLSQLDGIGQVSIGGATLPAVRVELNPTAMFKYGIGLEDVRAALASANANSPKGAIEEGEHRFQLYTNDQARQASDYRPLVIAYRNGAAVQLSDVADVEDSVQDLRNEGRANGEPSVLVILSRQPGANIIDTVDQVKAELPQLQQALPSDVNLTIVSDRSATIRASLEDTKWTLVLAVLLVTFVVYLTLGDIRAALVPAVVVPVSIIGTFGGMYLLGFSLDNLSLMALTIATGFVVDDAIVVLENIERHIEDGVPRVQAALRGAREVGFTVVSISISLVAVFIPILLMGGIVGRLFREFTATLSLAILISMVISLTTTPMMCAVILRPKMQARRKPRRSLLDRSLGAYQRTLDWSLRHGRLVMLALGVTIGLNVLLFTLVPKGFFPQEDTGLITGGIVADQSISFQLMKDKLGQLMQIVQADPAVESVAGYTGAGSGGGASQTNTGSVYVLLKPLSVRKVSSDEVIARLRTKLSAVAGGRLFLQTVQDIRVGARQSNAQYQFTLQADKVSDLNEWGPKLLAELQRSPVIADVNSDQQQKGLETDLTFDRGTAARLGITVGEIDSTLYDAFGQRQVSTIYNALNQYHVVMEVEPRYWQSPETLKDVYISTSGGAASGTQTTNSVALSPAAAAGTSAAVGVSNSVQNALTNAIANTGRGAVSSGAAVSASLENMVPLAAVSRYAAGTTRLSVNHHGLFASTTISFNLQDGMSLSDATAAVAKAMQDIHMPTSIHGIFAGTAGTFQQSLSSEPLLIAAALIAVYIVLGVLYESYIHPITIISTLPSAGVGAVLALMVWHTEFSIIALIGVILLIGIVKKNAIMMIDFAIHAERSEGVAPRQAIYRACLLRFRPIMMTTLAALLGAVPLAFSYGNGAELRRPLGISIVGGLIVSQVLTLYTTPVLYVYLDRLQSWMRGRWPALASAVIAALCLSACAVGPNYHRPAAPVPETYKELPKDAPVWTPVSPRDGANRGPWWSIYDDAQLDALERQVNLSNQNVKQFEAQYRQAVGLLDEARAQLFPVIGATGTAQRGGGGGGAASTSSSVGSGAGGRPINQFRLEATVSWTPDIWGTVRRQIESRKAAVQVDKADLANAQLSAQATLATDYFDLRAEDSLRVLLAKDVDLDRRALQIAQDQFKGGVATEGDVAEAQSLLQSTQAQLIAVDQQRGTFEHAIAVLTGHLPSEVSVSEAPLPAKVPDVPVAVPSSLLERNPSIAAAERQMQQESALIGVAVGAYFPTVSLSGLGGYASSQVSRLINLGNRIWSIGASATDAVYDFGNRAGAVTAARAAYDQYVAVYRQTVLTTFQQVEDQLLALRVLQNESDYEGQAVKSAQTAADVALNEYNAGTVPYTTVITALQTLITAQQTALTLQQNRLAASVALIEALGGGWTTADL